MTYEFQYLMHLLGSASTGKPADLPDQNIDWNKMFELAHEQMLMPLICYALKTNPSIKFPECQIQGYKESFSAVVTGCAKRSAVISLLEKMNEAAIPAAVVKGFSVAENYYSPELRISSDTDILISPENENRAREFLSNNGFTVEQRWENGHHFAAHHPLMGLLEVHIRLYDDIAQDVWFAGVSPRTLICQNHKKVSTADGTYFTLGDTDHLIFVILHMIKHFILCGMSLRMITDVASFMSAKKNSLDFDRIWSVIRKLKYEDLLSAVLWSSVLYCGFSADDFPGIGDFNAEKVDAILTDTEKGGWLGKNDYAARRESWQEYSRLIFSKRKSKLRYWKYMLDWQIGLNIKTLFPPKERLLKHYSVLNKFPWLLPLVWLHRIIFRSIPKGQKTKEKIVFNEHLVSDESKKRVEMFRFLGML